MVYIEQDNPLGTSTVPDKKQGDTPQANDPQTSDIASGAPRETEYARSEDRMFSDTSSVGSSGTEKLDPGAAGPPETVEEQVTPAPERELDFTLLDREETAVRESLLRQIESITTELEEKAESTGDESTEAEELSPREKKQQQRREKREARQGSRLEEHLEGLNARVERFDELVRERAEGTAQTDPGVDSSASSSPDTSQERPDADISLLTDPQQREYQRLLNQVDRLILEQVKSDMQLQKRVDQIEKRQKNPERRERIIERAEDRHRKRSETSEKRIESLIQKLAGLEDLAIEKAEQTPEQTPEQPATQPEA